MTTKLLIIGVFWAAAIILFALKALGLWEPIDYDLVAGGLALTVGGFALDKFWSQP